MNPQRPVVLVTGSSGLLGTRFIQCFGNRFGLISGDLTGGFDLLDPDACLRKLEETGVNQLDAIVHLAAFTDVSAAHLQQGNRAGPCYRLNVNGTENALVLANRFGAHLVHVSTDFVFDGKTQEPLDESAQPRPIEWYGETKFLAEEAVRAASVPWTILRLAFPYLRVPGARLDLVHAILGKLRKGESIFLFSDQVITPTFGDDIVSAIAAFIERKPLREIYHVTGPCPMSPYQLGIKLAGMFDLPAEQIVATSLASHLARDPRPRQQYLAMNNAKYGRFCEENGMPAPRSVEEAFAQQT